MDSSAAGLSPADLDAWTRSVVTEAGSPDGQLAVPNVIGNRLAAGGYGDSPGAITKAPGQFEVWQNGRAQNLDPRSAAYQQAAGIVNAVASGQADDNTGDATHFFSPNSQAALGRQPPSWGRGQPLAYVGGNAFFAPKGTVVRQQQSHVDVDGLAKLWTGGAASDAPGAARRGRKPAQRLRCGA